MTSEEEAQAWDNVTDAIIESAEQLRAKPMSTPPKPIVRPKPGDKPDKEEKVKLAKFYKMGLPPEVREHVKVYDRYDQELKNMIEYDPESGNGKRISAITGEVEDCYEYNGRIVVEGHGHPDELEFPTLIQKIKDDKEKFKMLHKAPTPEDHAAFGAELPKHLVGTDRSLDSMRCIKCQAKLKFIDEIQQGGEVTKAIQCTNANCGLLWEQKTTNVKK
jgi:hypothetical protein